MLPAFVTTKKKLIHFGILEYRNLGNPHLVNTHLGVFYLKCTFCSQSSFITICSFFLLYFLFVNHDKSVLFDLHCFPPPAFHSSRFSLSYTSFCFNASPDSKCEANLAYLSNRISDKFIKWGQRMPTADVIWSVNWQLHK